MKSLFLLPICLFVERVETYLLRTTTDVRINMITHPFITDFSLSFQKSTVFPICHSNLIRPTAQRGLISAPVLSVAFGALPYTHRTHLVWSHRTESNREPANYKSAALPIELRWRLEWQTGLEPATSSLEGWRSAIELLPQIKLTRRINHTGSIY